MAIPDAFDMACTVRYDLEQDKKNPTKEMTDSVSLFDIPIKASMTTGK